MTDAAVPTGRRQRSLHCGPEEQAELRDGVRAIEAFVRALRHGLPGGGGLNLLAAIAVLARGRGG